MSRRPLLQRIAGPFRRLSWRRLRITFADVPDWLRTKRAQGYAPTPLQPWREETSAAVRRARKAAPLLEPGAERAVNAPRFYGTVMPIKPDRLVPGPMRQPDLKLNHFKSVVVLPRTIVLREGRSVLVPFRPYPRRQLGYGGLVKLDDDYYAAEDPLQRGTETVIDEPVFLAGCCYEAYGHTLLEILPRLQFLSAAPRDAVVLTTVAMEGSTARFFEAMGVPVDRVRTIAGPTHCRDLYAPDSFVDIRRYVADGAWRTFERLKELGKSSSWQPAERIYVSRRAITRRALDNEAAVEALFASYGFTILRPEAMSMEDQICAFSHATMIAGTGGSGMHNMVFSAATARVLLLAKSDLVLAIDAMLQREPGTLGYVLGESIDKPGYISPWSIDLAEVERALKAHFGL